MIGTEFTDMVKAFKFSERQDEENIEEDEKVADDPAQHKQSHVLELLDAGEYTGNMVALPNNRVRVTHPAWFETGEGAPDFKPNQNIFNSKEDVEYIWDTERVFNNLYKEK